MANQDLVNYIQSALSAGQIKEDIAQILLAQGWIYNDIQAAFSVVAPPQSQPIQSFQQGNINHSTTQQPIKRKRSIVGRLILLIFLFLLGFGISIGVLFVRQTVSQFRDGTIIQEVFRFLPINRESGSDELISGTGIPNNEETQQWLDLFEGNMQNMFR